MNPVSSDLLLAIDRYVEELFAPTDSLLANNLKAARGRRPPVDQRLRR